MPQFLSRVYLHTVFSTKERRPYLGDVDVREQLHAYLGGVLRGLGFEAIAVGGVEDQVHLLHTLARTVPVCGHRTRVKTQFLKMGT